MLKNTKTRKLVMETLSSSSTPMTASELFECLQDKSITLSSIYRTLEIFCKEKLIIKDTDNKGVAIYTILEEHCHYLECNNCHKKIKLDYCPYHKINNKINKEYNFTVDEHNVVIYGTCENCMKK